jgi:hypothetical protein
LTYRRKFATTKGLIQDTFTGRNFGWLTGERAQAIGSHASSEKMKELASWPKILEASRIRSFLKALIRRFPKSFASRVHSA